MFGWHGWLVDWRCWLFGWHGWLIGCLVGIDWLIDIRWLIWHALLVGIVGIHCLGGMVGLVGMRCWIGMVGNTVGGFIYSGAQAARKRQVKNEAKNAVASQARDEKTE